MSGNFSISRKKLFGLLAALFISGAVFGAAVYHFMGTSLSEGIPWERRQETASSKIVAVRPDETGVLLNLSATIRQGEGRILEDTHHLVGFDFQESHHTAVRVVADELEEVSLDDDGVGLEGADVIFEVSASSQSDIQVSSLDGPSAGAAATVALMAAIENEQVRGDGVITGTINSDGTIGQIGGLSIFEDGEGNLHVMGKPAAAEEAGMKLLLVPEGQPVTYYRIQRIGPWERWVSTYEPISVLREVIDRKGWGLEIIEVSNISQASDNLIL